MGALLIKQYRIAIMLVGGLLLYGLMAFFTLPRTEDPEFDNLGGGVVTIYPGASASKVESLVTKPIEEVIQELEEVRTVTSRSLGGISIIGMRFWGNEAQGYDRRDQREAQGSPAPASGRDHRS